MKLRQNVLRYGCRPHYYLTHPIKFLRDTRSVMRACWRRITRGWCYGDVWNMYDWFLDVIPDMLDHLADHGSGYPGVDEFPTPESWENHLHTIASMLRSGRDEARDPQNEYADAYYKMIYGETYDRELSKKYCARDTELAQEQEEQIKQALILLGETPLTRLWD